MVRILLWINRDINIWTADFAADFGADCSWSYVLEVWGLNTAHGDPSTYWPFEQESGKIHLPLKLITDL